MSRIGNSTLPGAERKKARKQNGLKSIFQKKNRGDKAIMPQAEISG
jgi:hypothetical protein